MNLLSDQIFGGSKPGKSWADAASATVGKQNSKTVSRWNQVAGAITGTGEIDTALVVQIMNWAQHLLALALTMVAIARNSATQIAPLWLMLLAGGALIAYQISSIALGRLVGEISATKWLLGYSLLWLAALVISPEFIWFAFLLWLLAGHLLPFKLGMPLSFIILLATIVAPILHHGSASTAMIAGPLLGGIFTYTVSRAYLQMLQYAAEREALIVQLMQAQQEMNVLQDDLAFAQRQAGAVEERLRITRDLHDTVAQNLSSLKLLSRVEAQSPGQNSHVTERFAQFELLAAEGLTDLRRIIEKLAPQELENSALPTAIASMLRRLEETYHLETRLDYDASLPQLSQELELALLRSAQSAIANIRLHADATQVAVSVIDSGDSIRMDIIDNGVGFDPESLDLSQAGNQSFGLRFIRSRMHELGGGLEIESAPGSGTALSIYAPIRSQA